MGKSVDRNLGRYYDKELDDDEKATLAGIEELIEQYYAQVRQWLDLFEKENGLDSISHTIIKTNKDIQEILAKVTNIYTLGYVFEFMKFEIKTFDKSRPYNIGFLSGFHGVIRSTIAKRLNFLLHFVDIERIGNSTINNKIWLN